MAPRQSQLSRQGLQVATAPTASSTTSGGNCWAVPSCALTGSSSQESASSPVSACRSRGETNVLPPGAIPRFRDQQDTKHGVFVQTSFLGVCKPMASTSEAVAHVVVTCGSERRAQTASSFLDGCKPLTSVSEAAAHDGIHRDAVRRAQAANMCGSDSNSPTSASLISEQGLSADFSGHCYAEMIDDRMLTEIGRRRRPPVNQPNSDSFLLSRRRRLECNTRVRERLLAHHQFVISERLANALSQFQVSSPTECPRFDIEGGKRRYRIDCNKQGAYSTFLKRSEMPLPQFVRLLRGETAADSHPNKALEVPKHVKAWEAYEHRHKWETIVNFGVEPQWTGSFPTQHRPPKNHASATRAMNVIIKNIRKGQDANRYLVLDISLLDTLEGVFCSPFGAVQKGDLDLAEDARVIHDLSFPAGGSLNDLTQQDATVKITYDGARALALRFLKVEEEHPGQAKIMCGDVSGAFRHIHIHADHVGRFAGTIPELGILVIDLSCPFGWTRSPAEYWVAGGAINYLHSQSAPVWTKQPPAGLSLFDGKVWCDDHICIEPDVGTRLTEAELSLHEAMIDVLGPDSCNDDKFTGWARVGSALGLHWDFIKQEVSMPPAKIAKALGRVTDMLRSPTTSRVHLNKLLGSLRHVVTCIQPAAPFFQQLAALQRMTTRHSQVVVHEDARGDLLWFRAILQAQYLNRLPLARFARSQSLTIEIWMDASDLGLCAVFPARKEYLQVKFDEDERRRISACKDGLKSDFGINVRELMSTVFAAIVWGSLWKSPCSSPEAHVRMWIDNTSAVAWNNKRFTRNPFAQLLLRLLALLEVKHQFYVAASHIPGAGNVMADAGSRAWESPTMRRVFANLRDGWTQVTVPLISRKLSAVWARCSVQEL
ncbi:hypothetical protein FI667_g9648, partial [Globisporangium splendens]